MNKNITAFTLFVKGSYFSLTFIWKYDIMFYVIAGVAELADAPDLGSGGIPVQVQVLSPAPVFYTPDSR